MKLTTMTQVTLDGVMQGLGAKDEDDSEGFERGGWAIPLFDELRWTVQPPAYAGSAYADDAALAYWDRLAAGLEADGADGFMRAFEPPDDPPGTADRSHGLRVSGWKLESPEDSMP